MKLNKYGIVSGWYLFELADKAGQDCLHAKYPDVKYWLTRAADIEFSKQVAAKSKTDVEIVGSSDIVENTITVIVYIIAQNEVVARAYMTYTAKDHLAVEVAQ